MIADLSEPIIIGRFNYGGRAVSMTNMKNESVEHEELIKPLEALPLGNWKLSITGASTIWDNKENIQKVNESLNVIYNEVSKKLPAICILKSVVLTNNFRDDVYKYQKALGRTEELSANTKEYFIAGKTLRWGNGEIGSTYAVVIHPQEVAVGILEDDNSAKVAFARELGHVYEGLLIRKLYNIDERVIKIEQFAEIVESIAQSTFSEFFANITAFPYMETDERKGHLELSTEIIRLTNRDMKKAIAEYRKSYDYVGLWSYTIEKISFLFSQLGRTLGVVRILTMCNETETVNDFYNSLEIIDPRWKNLVKNLYDSLDVMQIKEDSDVKNIIESTEEIIKESFDLIGVIPSVSVYGGLRIDVPFKL